MKSLLLSLVLATALGFSACKPNHQPATDPATIASVAAELNNNARTGAHLCGAQTKKGQPCTRRVSDVHGKAARCWQHQG